MGRMLSPITRPLPAGPVVGKIPIPPPVAPRVADAPRKPPVLDSEDQNPFRKLAFFAGLATIFIRFGVLPELLYYFTGSNTYVLYLFAPLAILGCLFTGGLSRTFRARSAYLMCGFMVWMFLATPLSFWPGASANRVLTYSRTDFILLFIAAGLAVNWKEVRILLNTIALSGIVNLFAARLFAKEDNGRLSLDLNFDGIISNSNDLAAHLMLVLPFVLYFAMKKGRNIAIRIACGIGIVYGISVILGTASRGALVGLIAVALFCLIRASQAQRLVFLVGAPVVVLAMMATMPASTMHRLKTLFVADDWHPGMADNEAEESRASRSYLFQQSVRYTLTHPLLGVGLGQFSNYEGNAQKAAGLRGNWHETHCTYTQISSECGIPALLFFLGAMFSSMRLLSRTYKQARAQNNGDIANACFCVLIAMVGYLVAAIFLAMGYRFTFPAMVGLALAIHFAAQKQLAAGAIATPIPARPAQVLGGLKPAF
jgi:hypothetical protein